MIDSIMDRIKEYGLSIDSLYIQDNDHLDVVIDSSKLHELRSCSKMLVALAMGIAIDRGLFSLEENVYPYLEKYISNNRNKDIIKKWTIRTLLTHTTGYNKMLMSSKEIKEKQLDKSTLLEYVLNVDIENEPNTIYIYNNVEPFVISVLFRKKHNIDLEQFIKDNIFDKMNIKKYKWDKYGDYCPGCTGLFLLPKDFHKLGVLIMNDGIFNNNIIVPCNWIREMTKLQVETPNLYNEKRLFPKCGGGYYTFISRDGYVFRDGSNGQYIIINKEKRLVISIMSSEHDMGKITEIFRGFY